VHCRLGVNVHQPFAPGLVAPANPTAAACIRMVGRFAAADLAAGVKPEKRRLAPVVLCAGHFQGFHAYTCLTFFESGGATYCVLRFVFSIFSTE
jgi:hypothetical protein